MLVLVQVAKGERNLQVDWRMIAGYVHGTRCERQLPFRSANQVNGSSEWIRRMEQANESDEWINGSCGLGGDWSSAASAAGRRLAFRVYKSKRR